MNCLLTITMIRRWLLTSGLLAGFAIVQMSTERMTSEILTDALVEKAMRERVSHTRELGKVENVLKQREEEIKILQESVGLLHQQVTGLRKGKQPTITATSAATNTTKVVQRLRVTAKPSPRPTVKPSPSPTAKSSPAPTLKKTESSTVKPSPRPTAKPNTAATKNPRWGLKPINFVIQTSNGRKINVDTIPAWMKYAPRKAKLATPDMPFVAETLYHHGDFPVTSIGNGTALPYYNSTVDAVVWPAKEEDEALCVIDDRQSSLTDEIPHFLQQLFRCFTWWNLHPDQRPTLDFHENAWDRAEARSPVSAEIKDALEDVFNVKMRATFGAQKRGKKRASITTYIPWKEMSTMVETYGTF